MAKYLLGSDIGTSSCKTVILDTAGRVVAEASFAYTSSHPEPGWVEQDPQSWYAAFCQTTRRVLAQSGIFPGNIAAVAIAGVTHNPILLDDDGRLLRPAIHFWDRRSQDQVERIKHRWGDQVRARSLNEVDSLWTWPQLLWIRQNEPAIWSRVSTLLFPKDYVRHRLTDGIVIGPAISDTIDPAGTLLYDPRARAWIDEFVADLMIKSSSLPKVVLPTDVVGKVGRSGAADTGLQPGTAVVAGTTDTAAEVLGSGAFTAGMTVVKLASVGRIMVVMDHPLEHPHILNYPHVMDGLWYPGSVTKHGASAYSWARRVFWPDHDESGIYQLMDREAASAPPGCNGLLFHPHLSGEYAPEWDPVLRASFVGLTVQHGRGDLLRAVLEGVVYQIKAALDQVSTAGGHYNQIRLIGGGAVSSLWSQILADILDRQVDVPVQRSAAYGAGLLAGIAAGVYPPDPESIKEKIKIERYVTPRAENSATYRRLFDQYRDAGQALRSISHGLETLSGV